MAFCAVDIHQVLYSGMGKYDATYDKKEIFVILKVI